MTGSHRPLLRNVPLLFGLLALCIVGLLGASLVAYRDVVRAQAWRDHTHEVLATLAEVDAQAAPPQGLGGCALNRGQPRPPLSPPDAQPVFDELLRLVGENPVQLAQARAITRLAEALRQRFTEPLLQACDSGRAMPLAEAARITAEGAPLRRELSEHIAAMRAAERSLLAQRDVQLRREQNVAGLLFALFIIATVAMALAATVALRRSTQRLTVGNARLRREAERRELVQEELRASRSRLEMVLDHIPDAVLAFDARGLLQWVNPAAAQMFAMDARAAAGRPVGELVPELGAWLTMPSSHPSPGELPPARRERRELMIGLQRGGDEFPIEVAVVQTRLAGEEIGVCVCRDLREVERMERMKHEFVSMVSHELRTPLTSIRGSLSMLADGTAGELAPPVQRLVTLAHRNSERLVALVNDILDFEKLRAGEMAMHPEPLDLVQAAQSAIESNEGYAQQHGVNLKLVAPGEQVGVRADPLRLAQVLANLLSNAIKFSPRGGEVTVRVETGGRLWVTDEGPGVPAEFADRLFYPFAQADDLATRKHGGTGLGLAISRGLMEQMGGAIGVEPPDPAGGARFWIVLPGVDLEPLAEAAMPASGRGDDGDR